MTSKKLIGTSLPASTICTYGRDVVVGLDEPLGAHRLAVQHDPLADRLQVRAGEAARPAGRSRGAARRSSAPSSSCRWCRRPGSTGIARCGEPSRSTRALMRVKRGLEPALGPAGEQLLLHPGQVTGAARCSSSSGCRGRQAPSLGLTARRWSTDIPRPGPRRRRPRARSPGVPEKPTLDGLEEKWGARWEDRGHLPLRPGRRAQPARADLLDRHAAADRQRLAARRARLLLHPHRHRSPATSGCAAGRSSTRWAGTTTACPPSAGCRTTTASAATRRCPTTRRSRRRTKPGKRPGRRSRRRNFVELCERLTAEDEQAFEAAVAPARPVGRLVADATRTIDEPRPGATAQRAFLRNLARGEAYPAEAPTLWDVTFRTAVAQAELEDRERPGAYHRHRVPPAATAPVVIETTRPELLPACVALVAHPDDERYQPLFGTTVRTPLFGVEVPVRRAPPGRARQGLRHRDDLHVRRPHRRHLVARAAAADPRRSSAATAGSWPSPPGLACRAAGARTRELAGKTVHQRAASGSSSCCASPASWTASRGRSPTRSSSTRRATARSRSSPPASGTSATAAGTPTCATRCSPAAGSSQWHPTYMRHRYENWVDGPQRRLADQPAAVLRRAVPGLVPRSTTTASPTTTTPILAPTRPRCRSTRRRDVPAGLHRGPARRAGRLHRRPRRHGHLGHLVADARRSPAAGTRDPDLFAPRLPDGPAPAGARHHPHLAVLHRRPRAPRARRAAVDARRDLRLDPRPRPQEDVEVQGQRRHARSTLLERVRRRRRPLLGAPAARPGADTAVRRRRR